MPNFQYETEYVVFLVRMLRMSNEHTHTHYVERGGGVEGKDRVDFRIIYDSTATPYVHGGDSRIC